MIAWALLLGLVLTPVGLAGAATTSAATAERAPQEFDRCLGDGAVGLGLAMRWGFLDDPATGGLRGHWAFGDTLDAGVFRGIWRSENGRINGTVEGRWRLGEDGRGGFAGTWQDGDGSPNGSVRGDWNRGDRAGGSFAGLWSIGDTPAGTLRGLWRMESDTGGSFAGAWTLVEGFDMVPWDGFVQTTDGGVRLVQVVRFERGGDYRMGTDDLVYERDNPQTLEWRSSTVTDWDGLVVLVVVPRDRPVPHITVHTEQWSRVFEASEIPGLHLREAVDRAGHEIEIRGFRADLDRCERHATLYLVARWGFLPTRDDTGERRDGALTRWDGSLSTTEGAIRVHARLHWESGGSYDEGLGDAIADRTDRSLVEWRSSTTADWDGLAFAMVLPLERPEAEVTLTAGRWSRTWPLHELLGFHTREPVGDLGHEIEVASRRA